LLSVSSSISFKMSSCLTFCTPSLRFLLAFEFLIFHRKFSSIYLFLLK
jgi:hypothetical protein